MRFPHAEQLRLPCRFTRIVPGALHSDGRRYLPLLVFELADGFELGIVDRHHRVQPAQVGEVGVAQVIFLLSAIRLAPIPGHHALIAELHESGHSSTRPTAYGQVTNVLSWETDSGQLPYETLYTELVLDIGLGRIGVRTSVTAPNLAVALGTARIEVGDWLVVERSRIDVLGFSAKVLL